MAKPTAVDVTGAVEWGDIDGELLPLTKCACGEKFIPWDYVINIYEDSARECPKCGRLLYFSMTITVYEVKANGH